MTAGEEPSTIRARDGEPVRPAQVAPPEEYLAYDLGADLTLLRRLLPYVRRHAGLFSAALGLIPLSAGASLVQPLLLKGAIDAAIVDESRSALMTVVWLFLLAISVEFVARFAQVYAMQLGGQRILAELREETFDRVQRLHIAFFDRTPVGKVVTRVTNDIDSLGELFASGAVMAVADILMLLGIVAFMLALDWRLSLVAFAALPPLAIVVNVVRRYAREAFRNIRTRIAQLNAYLAEQVQGIAVVQAFGHEAECQLEYAQINAGYRDANHRAIRYDAFLYSVVESVSAATVAILLYFGAVRVGMLPEGTQSAAYVGTVVAFYEYIQRFFVPIRDLAQKYTIIQSALAAAERIFGIHDLEELDAPRLEDPPTAPTEDDDVVLALRGVTFAYRPGTPVLKDVTLEARRGETIALVGATGAGKTTVTSLLLRLYDVQEGHVVVGGHDVRELDRRALRERFAVVNQDVFLFAGTVLENITGGEATPDEARVVDALDRVGALELVERRGGLGARVEERGSNYSAGERQLLAFARALYLDRDILILDEATARIDSETEARLQRAILEVLRGRTALVIAHRLSTIRHADRILVFHKGRVVEEGDHRSLIEDGGIYARLVRLQFAGEEDAPGAAEASATYR
ncbi:MAG: ABC transporter ATP-binding protein [Sandaracinaceae bacterium]